MTVYVRYVDGKEYTTENWIDLINVINNAISLCAHILIWG